MSRTHRDTGFYGRPVCTLNNVLAQRSSSHEEQHTQHASLYILNNLLADSLFIRKTNITFCPTRIFSHKAVTVAPSVSTTRTVNALPTTRSSSFGPVSTLFFVVVVPPPPPIFLRSQQTRDRKTGSENQRSEVWVSHAQSRHKDTQLSPCTTGLRIMLGTSCLPVSHSVAQAKTLTRAATPTSFIRPHHIATTWPHPPQGRAYHEATPPPFTAATSPPDLARAWPLPADVPL